MLPPPGCRPLQFLHATCPGKSCSKGMISPVHTFSSSNNLSETVSQEKTRCVQSIGLLAGCRNRIKRRGELAHHWLLLRQCLCCISSSSILRIHLCVSRSTCDSYWLLLTKGQTMGIYSSTPQVQLLPDHASCSTSPAQLHLVIKGHVGASVQMWVIWSKSEEGCKMRLRGCERWRTAPALLRDAEAVLGHELHVD